MKNEIEDFINFVAFEKRLSKNTIISYKEDLLKYEEYMKRQSITDINKVSTNNIEKYLIYLNNNEYTITSIARKLTTIKAFHNYLYQRNITKSNVAEAIDRPKIKKALPKVLTVEQVDALLDIKCTTAFDYRNKAMLELLYATGLRISELLNLKLNDVDMENCVVRCLGKGNKERIVPIGEYVLFYLTQYLDFVLRPLSKILKKNLFFVVYHS